MHEPLTFQKAIAALQEYWAGRGCIIWQPYNSEVGAGTMNPGTFLRVLGPEPWNVAYDEPSIRPDDSRYGENPNRVQRHTQFQVILKPAPSNPQELLLGSYRALGIDIEAHDVRFVEDNWESPALGAWGLGWEVWLDGMEITQFTYFQQAGGFPLDSVAVEITYGLERIIMSLQGKTHFKDIVYSQDITYGEIFMQNEVEMSKYNLDEADVGRNSEMFELYASEAKHMLDKSLPIPAYNYLLKASHTFNILDARGAIGVTERARYFQRMRTLARETAERWIQRREELGHPLLKASENLNGLRLDIPPHTIECSTVAKESFVLEIGTEELPAGTVGYAASELRRLVEDLISRERLRFAGLHATSTPRRIVLSIESLDSRQEDITREARGPPVRAARDQDGNPSKAAIGFCRAQGVELEDTYTKADNKGVEYIFASVREEGRNAVDILSDALPGVLGSLSLGRSMRWNATNVSFSRPVRWILAMFGDVIVPFEFAGVRSSFQTRSLRGPDGDAQHISLSSASEYYEVILRLGITVGIDDRRRAIAEGSAQLASTIGGELDPKDLRFSEDSLLGEVANLVERPEPIMGNFEEDFLRLPAEVLVTVMKKHQRYFPIRSRDTGGLLASFITVANGPVAADLVRVGNESVLRARYADAKFFYEKDMTKRLEDFVPLLHGLTFQEKLGSMLDKQSRIEEITPILSAMLELEASEVTIAQKAAHLCKADLMTSVVVEFTALAGTMGRHYAAKDGVPDAVSTAIFEHVLPRSAGDAVAASKPGIVLAIADRLDSLVGLFAVGLAPKATSDPFALRRAALGVVQTLVDRQVSVHLPDVIDKVAALQPVEVSQESKTSLVDFIVRRMEAWVSEGERFRIDLVRASILINGQDPWRSYEVMSELAGICETEEFSNALDVLDRSGRLLKSNDDSGGMSSGGIDPNLFECDQEHALYKAWADASWQIEAAGTSLQPVVHAVSGLKPAVDDFFDNVFVMADDEKVRMNRLKLTRAIASATDDFFDHRQVQRAAS